MTSQKVLRQASPQSTDENTVPEVAERPKRSVSVVKKPTAKVPKAASAKPSKTAGKSLGKKVTPKSTPAASPAAAQTSSRSSARSNAQAAPRSSARPATQTKTRKPARTKTTALSPTPAQVSTPETLKTDALLPEQAVQTPAAETAAPATVTPPVVNDAELWEQDSPIRLRIAQLRTRNSLLDEQLQRLRPPFQVRGKKK
jgi:hypothetical protein